MTLEFLLKYLQQAIRPLFFVNSRQLDRIEKKLDRILALESGEFAGSIDFDTKLEDQTTIGAIEMKITDSQQFTATIRPKNKAGRPAPVEAGSVIWTGPSFVAITPAADGLSAVVVAMGVGSDLLSVSADADLGEGVVTISGTLPLVVEASQAVSLGIEASEPVEQVEAGPTPNPQ